MTPKVSAHPVEAGTRTGHATCESCKAKVLLPSGFLEVGRLTP